MLHPAILREASIPHLVLSDHDHLLLNIDVNDGLSKALEYEINGSRRWSGLGHLAKPNRYFLDAPIHAVIRPTFNYPR